MRTSPVHYIDPSAISITPNANNSHRDIAVYVAKGTKIKVRCPRAGLGMDADTSTYQEWTISGRNRRLADTTGTQEYTIYARLPKNSKDDGYLIFSPKTIYGDKYQYLTLDTVNGLADIEGIFISDGNWYVRLGDVSVADNGLRTVTLDTGILGTDDYNNNWAQNPDDLPLRIELGCTIDDEDVGLSPYVYWNQSLVLTATLVEGWTRMDIQRFDHWEIMRKTDDNPAESNWLDSTRKAAFGTSGEITLSHNRNSDDFNGAVATTFTIMAMGLPENSDSSGSSSSEDTVLVVLKTATITVLSETIERYELALSANIVGYNPQANTFDPTRITVRIRATDQRGDVFELTKGQFDNAGLAVEYAPIDSNAWVPLTFSGESTAVATASLNTATAFAAQQSLNVRLVRIIEIDSNSDSSSSDGTDVIELMQQTIAFFRDGEDSKEREWIFLRSQAAITFGTQEHPNPADIAYGQVAPTQAAGHVTDDSNQDGWVPEGWWDEMQGTGEDTPYEYGSYRDYIHDSDVSSESSSSDDGGHWGPFSTPKIWSHYGKDGISEIVQVTCVPGSLTVPFTSTGAVKETTQITVTLGMTVNENAATVTGVTASKSDNVDVYSNADTGYGTLAGNQRRIVIPSDGTVSKADVNRGIVFAITGLYNSKSYTANYTFPMIASEQGEDGQDGQNGQNGQNGEDAWTLIVNPSTVIINQSTSDVNDFGLPKYIDFSAKRGNATATVGNITNLNSSYMSTNMGLTVSASENRLQITGYSRVNGSYVTYGRITCTVPLTFTDAGGTVHSTTITVQIDVYVNLLGTWAVETTNAATTAVGTAIQTALGPNGAITSAYTAAINASATGLRSEFNEVVMPGGNKNLFGFCKGCKMTNSDWPSVPFIQGYGIVVNQNYSSRRRARISNLGTNGVGGCFTVSFQAKTTSGTGYLDCNFCDVQPTVGKGTLLDNSPYVAVNTGWQSVELHFDLTNIGAATKALLGTNSFNGFFDIEDTDGAITNAGAFIYVRRLKIERGDTATAFCEADEDIAAIGQGQMVTQLSNNGMTHPISHNGRTNVYSVVVNPSEFDADYVDYLFQNSGFILQAGKVYTLSYWACSSNAGVVITSYLYNPNIITSIGMGLYDAEPGAAMESLSGDGGSRVRLSTTWTQYFLRFYVTESSNTPRNLIVLRVKKNANAYTSGGTSYYYNGTIYISDVILQEGYVMSETAFSSLISQNARRISLVQQSGLKRTGIDIYNGIIKVQADNFQIVNSNGEQSLGVDASGNSQFRGTVKATNFFHGVVVHGEETTAYCTQAFLDYNELEDYVTNFTVGQYYTETEARSLSNDQVGIETIGMEKCTGPADIVVIKDSANDTQSCTVTLPLASDYEGKIVEIFDTRYTQPSSSNYVGNLYVRQADGGSKMKENFSQSINIGSSIKLNGNYDHDGGSYKLIAHNGYWIRLKTS